MQDLQTCCEENLSSIPKIKARIQEHKKENSEKTFAVYLSEPKTITRCHKTDQNQVSIKTQRPIFISSKRSFKKSEKDLIPTKRNL